MKIHIRGIAFFLCAFIFCALLPSCGEDDGSGHIFKMNIENNPANLDPQTASDRESVMVIMNMTEGLMKTDGSGAVVTGAAESFEMSEDGLVYTFHLRDMQWESQMEDFSAPVTADDFVFAFQRLFDPETASPHSGDFFCIKNSEAVLRGAAPLRELGVRAADEKTVEFTLEYPYYDFLSLLTKTAAAPCCREFFELTRGRYGMAADACASNGAFYLKEWNYDPYWDNNYLILRRNTAYSAADYVYPYSVNFFITGDSSNDAENFRKGDTDCFITDIYDEKLFDESFCDGRQTKTAGLLINTDSEYFGNKKLREALARSVNRDSYSHIFSDRFTAAYGIIPAGVTIQGRSYRDLSPDKLLSVYDPGFAGIWEVGLRSAGITSVDGVNIIVSESFSDDSAKEAVNDIAKQWQSDLLFYCGVETLSETEYENRMESGDFSIAVIEIGTEENSVRGFLENEIFEGNTVLAEKLSDIEKAESLSESAELIQAAETAALEDFRFIPICYEKEYLVCSPDSADLAYYPFSSAVWFGEAKYFD